MTSTKNIQVPIYDRRAGSGPTVVFLHYWGGSARTWRETIDLLPGRDVLALDFRGWGRSRALPPPYSLRQYAADVADVLSAEGVTDFVLVGHSMGGKVAQLVAAGRPSGLHGLVLVAPGPAMPAEHVTREYREFLSHAYDDAEAASRSRDDVLTATPLNDEQQRRVLEDSLSASVGARLEWPLNGIAEDISDRAVLIDTATIVLAAENDVVEPAEVLRSNLVPFIPHAQLRVTPKSGHLIPLEAPKAVAEAIEDLIGS